MLCKTNILQSAPCPVTANYSIIIPQILFLSILVDGKNAVVLVDVTDLASNTKILFGKVRQLLGRRSDLIPVQIRKTVDRGKEYRLWPR